jgi:DNA-binding transcriptional MerR regulator
MTLNEIKQLLELTRNGQRPCQAVRELAYRHLNDIDVRIHQLRSLRNELRDLLRRRMVARNDELCPLISSITLRHGPGVVSAEATTAS